MAHISLDNLKEYSSYLMTDTNVLKRNTEYALDSVVNKGQVYLKCTNSGTSSGTTLDISGVKVGDTLEDGTVSWEVISITGAGVGAGKGMQVWEEGKQYKVSDTVVYDNKIWFCKNEHTSTSTFDKSNWVCISGNMNVLGMETNTLWEGSYSFGNNVSGGSPPPVSNMIELKETMTNYEFLCVVTQCPNGTKHAFTHMDWIPVDTFIKFKSFRVGAVATETHYNTADVAPYDNTHLYINYGDRKGWAGFANIVRIYGARNHRGSVEANRVVLFDGIAGGTTQEDTVTLSDFAKNYDILDFSFRFQYNNHYRYITRHIDVGKFKTINDSNFDNRITFVFGYKDNDNYFDFPSISTNLFGDSKVVTILCNKTELLRITGTKYIQSSQYSTEETLIGTWIDGKPLYRKVYEGNSNQINTGLQALNYNIVKFDDLTMSAGDNIVHNSSINGQGVITTQAGNIIKNSIVCYTKRQPIDTETYNLLHFNSAISDIGVQGFSWGVYNGATIYSPNFKFGGGCLYIPTGGYIQSSGVPNISDGDFTIDFWVYPQTTERYGTILSTSDDTGQGYSNGITFMRNVDVSGDVCDMNINNSSMESFSFRFSGMLTNTWYHVALVRSGNTFTAYKDGVKVGSHEAQGSMSVGHIRLGRSPAWNYGNTLRFTGLIDEFRITKKALWESDFTPPTSEY